MRFVIVTGMSGAGKSTALKMLEDMGYFCVDNLPIPLLPRFVGMFSEPDEEVKKIALGIDIRGGQDFGGLKDVLDEMDVKEIEYEILFLDAQDDVLIKRYKETRRQHPLSGSGRVDTGIAKEREKIMFLKMRATYILDTSKMLTRELKLELEKIFVKGQNFCNLYITVMSFGFKYGIPSDSDLVFDVRFLPNPYYIDGLREKTGNDPEVQDYVMGNEKAEQFLDKLKDMTELQKGSETMSFSGKVREELSENISQARHCRIAELAAFIGMCGTVSIDSFDRYHIKIHSENIVVARKVFTLLKKTFNIRTDISVKRNVKRESVSYLVVIKSHEDALRVLQATKMIGEQQVGTDAICGFNPLIIRQVCCRRAFLRGVFQAAGSMSDPNKSYHFEIVCTISEIAEQIRSVICSFGLDAKIVRRKKSYVVYLKEGSQIVDILNVMEAHVALMELENVRILKEMRNSVNRKVNCETANINKTVSAAVKQVEDITYLRDMIGFENMPDNLVEAAYARLDHPDATLKELGESLTPPVGKSGINHRLRKLSEMAESLRQKQGGLL